MCDCDVVGVCFVVVGFVVAAVVVIICVCVWLCVLSLVCDHVVRFVSFCIGGVCRFVGLFVGGIRWQLEDI